MCIRDRLETLLETKLTTRLAELEARCLKTENQLRKLSGKTQRALRIGEALEQQIARKKDISSSEDEDDDENPADVSLVKERANNRAPRVKAPRLGVSASAATFERLAPKINPVSSMTITKHKETSLPREDPGELPLTRSTIGTMTKSASTNKLIMFEERTLPGELPNSKVWKAPSTMKDIDPADLLGQYGSVRNIPTEVIFHKFGVRPGCSRNCFLIHQCGVEAVEKPKFKFLRSKKKALEEGDQPLNEGDTNGRAASAKPAETTGVKKSEVPRLPIRDRSSKTPIGSPRKGTQNNTGGPRRGAGGKDGENGAAEDLAIVSGRRSTTPGIGENNNDEAERERKEKEKAKREKEKEEKEKKERERLAEKEKKEKEKQAEREKLEREKEADREKKEKEKEAAREKREKEKEEKERKERERLAEKEKLDKEKQAQRDAAEKEKQLMKEQKEKEKMAEKEKKQAEREKKDKEKEDQLQKEQLQKEKDRQKSQKEREEKEKEERLSLIHI
eukprot:TRINITY_DN5749_c0_g1_i13.p1 TRINITY_DN5749_c0_g1~~TRINITY_DN5749_c0_g1_i13.p1  ORF type:complete len:533 (-),score=207.62 TRINITY_DN5749_c0_g1_i13:61-1578(-)